MELYQIYGSARDGCNGSYTWACDGLIYTDMEKAQEKLEEKNKYSSTFYIEKIETKE